jgi:TetR/AcrR family transcriptional repressor of nem operon
LELKIVKRARPYDREKALGAAMMLFWEKGYHATSLKHLESALCMKPGSIYAAFGSKEGLFLLALEHYYMTSKAGFNEAIRAAESPLSALTDHLRSYARLAPNDPQAQVCMILKSFVDTRSTEPTIAAKAGEYTSAIREVFAAAFDAAIRAGELPDGADTARLARRFQSYVTMLRIELHQGTAQSEVSELAEDFAQTLDAMRVSPAA